MRNLWIQTEYPCATWCAEFGAASDEPVRDPGKMLEFVSRVLEAGQRHEIFAVREAPEIEFRGQNNTELVKVLRTIWRREQVVDFFGFTAAAMAPHLDQSSTVGARVAWYDEKDEVVEGERVDLGQILRAQDTHDYIPNGFMKSYPPMRITGMRVHYSSGGAPPTGRLLDYGLWAPFEIHSDIWLPWVKGSAHPWWPSHTDCLFDNRELASRHTPRLNAFLAETRRACEEIGGTWYLDRDVDATVAPYLRWLDDSGVLLDAEPPPPEERMPPEALAVEWKE